MVSFPTISEDNFNTAGGILIFGNRKMLFSWHLPIQIPVPRAHELKQEHITPVTGPQKFNTANTKAQH
jgi:hypothetical protein